jgi:asparagine synthase (glutamine-hydrolysing)
MCGFAAIASSRSIETGLVEKMVKTLVHRGPDGNAFQELPGCHLGHTRLSIIDLDTGAQPMADSTGRYWISYNGEIYNYREIRDELFKKGHQFKTQSDTEVILESFKEWGNHCLDRFRGMFAFVIWDSKKNELFSARDLFGEKPLYYASLSDGTLILGSEIKALLGSCLISPSINLNAVDAYLTLGYIPPDRTIYTNIQVLPPGHWLNWQGKCHRLKTGCYWKPQFSLMNISLEESAYRLRGLISKAVQRQMVADVPVGAFLSGGLDSSTIVALMHDHSTKRIKTFSVGFGGLINELPYAREVAEQYQTEHYEIDLEIPPLAELFEQVTAAYDEPFGDSSNIPTYLISQFARKEVKAVLSGDGGDELFGGYAWYTPLIDYREPVDSKCVGLLSRLLNWRIGNAKNKSNIWKLHVKSRSYFCERERREVWGVRLPEIDLFTPGDFFFPGPEVKGINQALYFDMTSYLPGDILVKIDRAAMANSLETRAPFLDRDLVEFMLTLPAQVKVTSNDSKIIMRHAMSDKWPLSIRNRKKQGFGVPFSDWLKHPELHRLCKRVFSEKSLLSRLFLGLSSVKLSPDSYQTWLLLSLGVWLEQHQIAVA